jgi:hypothetical protein
MASPTLAPVKPKGGVLRPLAPALLLDPDDRPGCRSPDDLVLDRAYVRMWLFSAATAAAATLAVAITMAVGLQSRVVGVALTALAMLTACTFVVMVVSAWGRQAFVRQSKSSTFIHGASAGGCVAAAALSWLWELVDPIA